MTIDLPNPYIETLMPENIESHGKPRAFIARAILVAFVLVYVGLSIFVAVAATDTSPDKTTAHTSPITLRLPGIANGQCTFAANLYAHRLKTT